MVCLEDWIGKVIKILIPVIKGQDHAMARHESLSTQSKEGLIHTHDLITTPSQKSHLQMKPTSMAIESPVIRRGLE
jgi:hypothetical protein